MSTLGRLLLACVTYTALVAVNHAATARTNAANRVATNTNTHDFDAWEAELATTGGGA